MPSGSHGGGGGGHSSGGSSSGGGGWGGGRSGGYGGSGRPIGPRYVYRGDTCYVVSPVRSRAIALLTNLAIIAAFVAFIYVMSLTSSVRFLSKIRADYDYYQQMIAYAEQNPEYIKTGKITDKFYNQDAKKYYLTYSLLTDDGKTLNGYTFSCYTLQETNAFPVNSSVQIAVNSVPVTLDTDSITMDYKDMPITRDGEYTSAMKTRKTCIIVLSIMTALIAAAIVARIVVTYSQKGNPKTLEEQGKPVPDTTGKNTNQTYCPYCGGSITPGERKCPGCGARQQ